MLYTKFTLNNGLTVIHHPDNSTQLCVMNILYKVGSKDEDPEKTGFAHLFEHLMFGGSINIPDYDTELQNAGGENNAFTSNDITNYYLTVPANNIETGFWLESDRMLSLNFNQNSLDVQRSVVIEEFKERYLNQPYGDLWLHLLPLCYEVHPYSWPTIGKDISHIEQATLDDVKAFFKNFYCPNNAIMVVAGNISLERTKELTEKWFGDIPSQQIVKRPIPVEPKQQVTRRKTIEANVPLDCIVMAYHTCERMHPDYYATDLISDLLGSGKSARLFNELVKKSQLFSEIDCYLTGDIDPGLLVIEGKLIKGIKMEDAEKAIRTVLEKLALEKIDQWELDKLKNKAETNIQFNDLGALNRAMKLAYCENLGDIELANHDVEHYLSVQQSDIQRVAGKLLDINNCSIIYYNSK